MNDETPAEIQAESQTSHATAAREWIANVFGPALWRDPAEVARERRALIEYVIQREKQKEIDRVTSHHFMY